MMGFHLVKYQVSGRNLEEFGFSTVTDSQLHLWRLHDSHTHRMSEAEDVDRSTLYMMLKHKSLMYLTTSRPDIMFGDLPFDLEAYTDNDYAGASLDRKSIIGGCQFLGSRLISWQCKKQTIVANSTTEGEYVAAASCWEVNCAAADDAIQVSIVGLTYYCCITVVVGELILERFFGRISMAYVFWQTATASTLDNGEMEITTTKDGKVKIVTDGIIRAKFFRETKVPQPSSLPHTNVADEAASTGVDVRYGGATTSFTCLEAG
ncbi:hypothetical protein Tco_0152813 [Tanacetum coccineum]